MATSRRGTAAAAAVVTVVALTTVSALSGHDVDDVSPSGPKPVPPTSSTHRPQDAGNGAAKDEAPGSASEYWTEECRRNASPARMPDPREP